MNCGHTEQQRNPAVPLAKEVIILTYADLHGLQRDKVLATHLHGSNFEKSQITIFLGNGNVRISGTPFFNTCLSAGEVAILKIGKSEIKSLKRNKLVVFKLKTKRSKIEIVITTPPTLPTKNELAEMAPQ